MDINERFTLSFYEKIGTLDEEHNISLVQHRSSHKIFVKKELTIYNKAVFEYLKDHPVPFMPAIYEIAEDYGRLTVIEEYISGDTLEDLLLENGPFSLEEGVNYFLQLCDIVSHLHKCEPAIIHRDIKPSNIIITPSKSLYLLDMNAGKFVSRDSYEDTYLLGTPGYAAPEQYGFGDFSSDEHTDIYALGVLLRQILSTDDEGRTPVYPVDHIIRKCTQMHSNQRYHSIDKLVREIRIAMGWDRPNPSSLSELPKRAFLPPGFRSGRFSHMLVAASFYFFAIYCVIQPNKNKDPFIRILIERGILLCIFLFTVGITFNYLKVQERLPFFNHENKFMRRLGILLTLVIGIFLLFSFMCTLEIALHI